MTYNMSLLMVSWSKSKTYKVEFRISFNINQFSAQRQVQKAISSSAHNDDGAVEDGEIKNTDAVSCHS